MATKKNSKAAPVKSALKKASATPPKKAVQQPRKAALAASKPAVRKPAAKAPAPVKKAAAAKAAAAPKAIAAKQPIPQPKLIRKSAQVIGALLKNLSKKPVKNVQAPASKAPAKAVPKVASRSAAPAEPKKPRFSPGDLEQFKIELLAMRDRITGQSGSMRNDALQHSDEINPEEDGTDAFMRLQTLEQVSSQQQIITNIDEALRSIQKGTYGACDMCGELINKPRLSVLPFAKYCIHCQSDMERSRRPGGRR